MRGAIVIHLGGISVHADAAGSWPSPVWRLTPEAERPVTRLQTDIPSGRLIIARDDDPLEYRGAHRRYQSIGGSNPSDPIHSLRSVITAQSLYCANTVWRYKISPEDLNQYISEKLEFRGRDFGSRVHEFAEAYALGEDVSPTADDTTDEQHIKALLDSLTGDLHVEERAVLPLDADGTRVAISGMVNLIHETHRKIEIIDYKTDRTRRGHQEYRKQLSAYYHALSAGFPDKSVTASLFYTANDEREFIDPLSQEQLRDLVRDIDSHTTVDVRLHSVSTMCVRSPR